MTADTTDNDTDLRFLVSDLCSLLEAYLPAEQVRDVYRAYLFAAEAHEGQHRMSGEPYIYHPVAVARILAEMRMDANSLVAAILHDVIEDTATAKEQLEREFGKEVAELVDGVSKLTQIKFESKAEAQAENFRKMILAMVRDIRVIMVKLADRLHNMRTLGVMRPDKKRRIARETLEIYAPIANRLGMNTMRLELADLGFAACFPMRYRILSDAIKKARGNRKEILHTIEDSIKKRLQQEDLHCTTSAREKHLYSIYLKMIEKSLPFAEVFDVYAFRLIVDKVDDCYRALGIMHNLYKPVPGKFKDYIAIPKSNGYQSLHTILFGPYGVPIEVQIRTRDMDSVADAGIAAHWLYKSEDKAASGAQTRAREWLRELLDLQTNAGNSLEFLENVKIDLFPDKVYIFTPNGEIMELPRGATAVDFAYAVHTDVGNTCIAAKIDRRLAPLRSPLYNGQTIEIIAAPGAHPNPNWLNFVVTGKARANIRHYLKNLHHEEGVNLGQRLLDKALSSLETDLNNIPQQQIEQLLNDSGFQDINELLEDIGIGNRSALLVARQLVPLQENEASDDEKNRNIQPLAIKGTEGIVVSYARCCRPIPGDPIAGFISTGRGIVIHYDRCKNIADIRPHSEKWIDVEWQANIDSDFSVEVHVEVNNQRGVLATVAAAIADTDSNIENVHIDEKDSSNTTLLFTIAVQNRKHLAKVMRHVRKIPSVMRISRWKE
ncbi:MAG: bifunctional GTP diphosphokinase/guanosine-3',5'-bis pyrophosphate 3'-pyrophosphohydrolase [Gammaproteobacteria bacterium]|nr:bifunctional GTP diphosphokinase/guanosine-3',5'-bis pyrophosphate 3'-pyrophosphohydrolase [Gammaproteobacteria bacterium]